MHGVIPVITPLEEMQQITEINTYHVYTQNLTAEYANDYMPGEDRKLLVLDEIARNRITNSALKIILHQHIKVGKINQPKGYRKSCSLFGLSRNDACLYHGQFWKNELIKATVVVPTVRL